MLRMRSYLLLFQRRTNEKEHPWNAEEEKKELLSLIVEYNDADKVVHKFFECKNFWVECNENFERLSNKVLIRTCPCGIVFKTYDPKKVYHSNSCRASYVREKIWNHDSPKKETKAKEA
jgi:hypothetical protein